MRDASTTGRTQHGVSSNSEWPRTMPPPTASVCQQPRAHWPSARPSPRKSRACCVLARQWTEALWLGANTAIRGANAAAVQAQRLQAGYGVSARNDVIRIAPHFYNTADDVVGALRELARLTR